MELSLNCAKRSPGTKARALRRDGRIPASLYGHDGSNSVDLTVDAKDASTLLRYATVNGSLVKLTIPDLSWNGQVLIREAQMHPWRGLLYSLSFFSVANQSSVDVVVPLNFTGDAVGVTEEKGMLDTVVNEMPIQCDPASIPESIDIDVSSMKVGDILHVEDIVFPKGVKPTLEPQRTVVSVQSPTMPAAASEDSESLADLAAPDAAEAPKAEGEPAETE
ncbi:MAG: 50S ribosomal protein L25/general stress protein Ctc [Elainellaceae cyanobacterium]